MLSFLPDESKGRRIPKCGGTTDAQYDLVIFRRIQEFAHAFLDGLDQVAYRRLTVGGPHEAGACRSDCIGGAWADFGGAGAEARSEERRVGKEGRGRGAAEAG